ncbi:hypothetical protein BD779DRAFT_1677975 [Infundibulicybe gibba]|nr:hypothetical protein BD779DRAFT_1677975 [Infundibulicybe gibba]
MSSSTTSTTSTDYAVSSDSPLQTTSSSSSPTHASASTSSSSSSSSAPPRREPLQPIPENETKDILNLNEVPKDLEDLGHATSALADRPGSVGTKTRGSGSPRLVYSPPQITASSKLTERLGSMSHILMNPESFVTSMKKYPTILRDFMTVFYDVKEIDAPIQNLFGAMGQVQEFSSVSHHPGAHKGHLYLLRSA